MKITLQGLLADLGPLSVDGCDIRDASGILVADAFNPRTAAIVVHAIGNIGPLVEALEEVIAYRRGMGAYDFHRLPDDERSIASVEAWEALELKLDKALAAAKSVEVQSCSE